MKKAIIFIAIVSIHFTVFSQSQEVIPGDSVPWELRKQSFIYSTANAFNDPLVARMALYNLLAENPGNASIYDSLALSYLQYNQNVSAALVAQQALQLNPQDLFAMEIAAASFEKIGVKDKALINYEKLHLANGDINTLYKISFLQYELTRFQEANTSLDIIIGDPQSEDFSIRFPTEDGQGQDVSLKIAAHRLKAMILEAQGETQAAKEKYLEVLKMSPGLQVAQKQLRELTNPLSDK